MFARFEDIARRAFNARLTDFAEHRADLWRIEQDRERIARARRGDTSYTRDPRRFAPYR